jgi:hypothetical protein
MMGRLVLDVFPKSFVKLNYKGSVILVKFGVDVYKLAGIIGG